MQFIHRRFYTLLATVFLLPLVVLVIGFSPLHAEPNEDAAPKLSVAAARQQARLLHETYESTLQALHRRYFKDDGRMPVPSRVLDEVFADLSLRTNIKARWMAVNAQVMTLGHEPQDDFEKQAARELAKGQDEFERVEKGVYRHAGSISLFASCLKCHAPAPMNPTVHRVAALVINVPVKQD